MLLGGRWTSDLNQWSVSGPGLTSDLHNICPGQPGTKEKALAVILRTAERVGAAGRSGRELCVLERMLGGEVIMSVSKLAWLTHRKAEVTNYLCK